MGYFYTDEELAHHGILGQKWGVRRFETEGGHLTAAGKQRYDGDPVSAKEKNMYAKASKRLETAKADYKEAKKKYGNSYDAEAMKMYSNAQGMYDLRKRQAKDAKARIDMAERKKVSKHEQKLIEKYKSEGMSEDEAALKAYKRAKLEKTLAIAGTVTVAAAAAYGAKKYHDYVTDEVMKAGSLSMKRITNDNSTDLHDTFYAAFNKKDTDRYTGLYGKQISTAGDVYQKTINIKDDLKIASDKNAKQTMAEVLSKASKESKDEVISSLKMQRTLFPYGSKQHKTLNKAIDNIEKGKYDSKATYDALNINMTGGNNAQIFKDFKGALKDKGYSGIKDRNDISYSGYQTKSARIIFDNSKVKVDDVRKVAANEINNKNAKEQRRLVAQALTKPDVLGMTIGSIAAVKGSSALGSKMRDTNAINEYKKEHPNTKLSNDEILENVYGGKS